MHTALRVEPCRNLTRAPISEQFRKVDQHALILSILEYSLHYLSFSIFLEMESQSNLVNFMLLVYKNGGM